MSHRHKGVGYENSGGGMKKPGLLLCMLLLAAAAGAQTNMALPAGRRSKLNWKKPPLTSPAKKAMPSPAGLRRM